MIAGSGAPIGGCATVNESYMAVIEDYPVARGIPFTGPPSKDSAAGAIGGLLVVQPHFSSTHDKQVVGGVSRAGVHLAAKGVIVDVAVDEFNPVAGGAPCRGITAVEPLCGSFGELYAIGDGGTAARLGSGDAAA